MLNGVPGGDPLTFAVAVAAAGAAGLLVYRDADRHGHYHALSASIAVGIAALVGYFVASLVGLVVATGYVLLLYLLSYPSTPGIDGTVKPRRSGGPDGGPRGDAGENIAEAGDDEMASVIRVEIADEDTLRELAGRYDDVPVDAPTEELRSLLRVKALSNVVGDADGDGEVSLRDWAEAEYDGSVDDWHDEPASGAPERPSEGAAAWNAAPASDDTDAGTAAGSDSDAGTTAPAETDGATGSTDTATTAESTPSRADGDAAADEAEVGSIEAWESDPAGTHPDRSTPDAPDSGSADRNGGAEGAAGWTTESGTEDTESLDEWSDEPVDGDTDPGSIEEWTDASTATAENEPDDESTATASNEESGEFGWAEVEE